MFIEEMKRKTKSSGNILHRFPGARPEREPRAEGTEPERDDDREHHQDEQTERPGREVDAHGESDRDVEDSLDEAVQDHAAELAGEQRGAAHRRQLQAVEEPDLHVARELGPCVHGREERAWMNGTASANARKDSVGKPGRLVAAWSPPEFTSISAVGKISGGTHIAG